MTEKRRRWKEKELGKREKKGRERPHQQLLQDEVCPVVCACMWGWVGTYLCVCCRYKAVLPRTCHVKSALWWGLRDTGWLCMVVRSISTMKWDSVACVCTRPYVQCVCVCVHVCVHMCVRMCAFVPIYYMRHIAMLLGQCIQVVTTSTHMLPRF